MDWISLCEKSNNIQFCENHREHEDVLCACLDLAYNRAKEALVAYAKHREKFFKEHDKILDTIEELLQENIKDIKDDGQVV